jgi:predicted phosphodiesterase
MKKTKKDLFTFLDKCLVNGSKLPNGKPISRNNLAEYCKQNNIVYYYRVGGSSKVLQPIKNTGDSFSRSYQEWLHQNKNKNVVFNDAGEEDKEDLLHKKILKNLNYKDRVYSLTELTDRFNTGYSKIKAAIEELINLGHNIHIKDDNVLFNNLIPKSEDSILNVKKLSTGSFKFGVTGDNHLASKYERLDVLNSLYDYFESEGITTVYNTGNWIDGEARFNKHDLICHGMDNQIQYFLKNFPQRKNIITRFITGDDHEGWYTQREGVNIGSYMQFKARDMGRTDLVFLGHMEHDEIIKTKLGETRVRVLHPGGGSSYATSYSVQKIVESYTGGDKPDILLVGHYHKAEYTYYRGVHIVQTGTTEDQTPFMRKKKLAAHLGGWVVEFSNDDKGAVTKFKTEFIPFYDKQYYKEGWEYKH